MPRKNAPDEGSNKPRMWRPDDPRRLRMAEKKAAILLAARPILLRDGLGGATLDRVAAEGDIAKMTLYRHFPNKEALFEGLIDAMCEEMRQAIESAPTPSVRKPWADRLADELRAFTSALIQPDALALYRQVVAEGWRLPRIAHAFANSGLRVIRSRLAALMQTAQLPVAAFETLAGEVVALALGDAYQRALLGIPLVDDTQAFDRQIEVAVAHALAKTLEATQQGLSRSAEPPRQYIEQP